MIVPPREKDEDQPAVGLEETLVTMWHSLSQVRSVVIRTFRFGLDELLVAIGQGLELAKLESVELLFERDSSTSRTTSSDGARWWRQRRACARSRSSSTTVTTGPMGWLLWQVCPALHFGQHSLRWRCSRSRSRTSPRSRA